MTREQRREYADTLIKELNKRECPGLCLNHENIRWDLWHKQEVLSTKGLLKYKSYEEYKPIIEEEFNKLWWLSFLLLGCHLTNFWWPKRWIWPRIATVKLYKLIYG